ncbi:MAG: hypothetical protein COU09_03085 [Candidatus Harrisonbacteria bacterium CG10_big_fil_rev_8_21_14_0_10_44_23]|uniref:L,D-TPase catalytic domain-containing protein n=1 Tax=Candidatus Harrisonbacteria bacterium CG10_big_fil_rev_8_21_14_0_10_44_23 TaxID=1974585 RepID=A0A2H0UPF0_9BACT|nr:MAG: hypothetical protein COU09_03085 [Candidatus Harrisonbacteria bacterium CG10_big_fil_rev_8_21_14_0_10_44_23]
MSLLKTKIPLWAVVIILWLAGAAFIFVFTFYQTKIYNYQLLLPNEQMQIAEFNYGAWPALSQRSFFEKVKEKFILESTNFIEADLSQMKIRYYQDGQVLKEGDILSKGKEGSWWETPAGLYKVEFKKPTHFSSFGQVYQPWSMAFQGNFFIHGWPHYPNGDPVARGYSGGCIRLSNEDAKSIYNEVEVGTPVLVYEEDFKVQPSNYQMHISGLSASHYLAADLDSNFVFLQKSADEKVAIASITKFMTALITAEFINLDHEITISQDMVVETSLPRLIAGERVSAYQLLFPLLLESSNEAAYALAEFKGLDTFVALMNRKATALGLEIAHFSDPAGISADNQASLKDLFYLLRYLKNNRSFILNISSGQLTNSIYGAPEFANLKNFNEIDGLDGFIGGKTGKSTSAKETFAAIYQIPIGTEAHPIAIIVTGSDNAHEDTRILYDWIKNNYSNKVIEEPQSLLLENNADLQR